MQLSAVDSNLLVMLHPLLQTRSVNKAAQQLGLSPSATSHALARLRDLLGDELLVRAGRGLVLTPRGAALAPLVAQAVRSLQQLILPAEDFRPHELQRTFHLLYSDSLDWVLLPALDATLQKEAPSVDVHTHNAADDLTTRLREGSIDLAFVVNATLPPDMHTRSFMHDRFVSIVRVGHPCLQRPMTLKRFAALQHIMVAPRGTAGGVVDVMLRKQGLERRVARTFTSFLPAPFLVTQSDYVLTLPQSVARIAATLLKFEVLDMPVAPPGYEVRLAWHEHMHQDPAHQWFRDVVALQGAALQAVAKTALQSTLVTHRS